MRAYLDFERPIADLEIKLKELRELEGRDGAMDIADEMARLEAKARQLLVETYGRLSPWQKTQVARHAARPRFRAFADRLLQDFTTLAGDRGFGEDAAIIGGLARFRGRSIVAIGHEKGDDTESRLRHNFGMARPEGYRKAQRLMRLAGRFGLPVITLVDTPGAYPGIDAEERGQAEAIARSTEACLELGAPLVAAIVGEGGSGGAVALATGNAVLMFEHAIYSVISPEGAASILFRSAERAQDAADALKLTAQDLERLGVVDQVVPEPVGGAHREPERAIDALGDAIAGQLAQFQGWPADRLRQHRREKFLKMGRNGLG
jgi:acetyl-CoA carboxylase carboxyl transferase subunit alpha